MADRNPTLVKTSGTRLYFLDNLRSIIIFLVVLLHAGVVYESTGIAAIFWLVDDPQTNDAAGLVNLVLDIFLMPALFFISGYLTPASVENRTGWQFLVAKFNRLMVPWMIAVLTLMPLYKFIFLASRNLPQEAWTSYFHFSNGIFSQSWLWFLPVLFLFNGVYLLLSHLPRVPIKVPLHLLVLFALVVAVASTLGMEVLQMFGWTKNALINFQNERLLVYFLTFLLGVRCFHLQVFASRPVNARWYLAVNALSWIPVTCYTLFLLIPFFKPGSFIVSPLTDRLILWLSLYVSMLCLIYLSIETFWRYFDKPGKIWNELNRNSYYVYIIHVIVMGGIAMLLLDAAIPSLVKYLILVLTTWISCNVLISLYRMIARDGFGFGFWFGEVERQR